MPKETTVKKTVPVAPAKEKKEKREAIVFAHLPLVSALAPKLFHESRKLLEELESNEETLNLVDLRSKEIKQRLMEIQAESKQPGLRYGNLAFASYEVAGRRTLSAKRLIEEGVKAALLEKCYSTGEPSVRKEFRKVEI